MGNTATNFVSIEAEKADNNKATLIDIDENITGWLGNAYMGTAFGEDAEWKIALEDTEDLFKFTVGDKDLKLVNIDDNLDLYYQVAGSSRWTNYDEDTTVFKKGTTYTLSVKLDMQKESTAYDMSFAEIN